MATSPHYSSRSPRERERQSNTTVPPYTEEEERWLKTKFGDEYHFLRFVGLDIRRADDRYAGRRFLRKIRNGELSLDIFESEASCSGYVLAGFRSESIPKPKKILMKTNYILARD